MNNLPFNEFKKSLGPCLETKIKKSKVYLDPVDVQEAEQTK
jgi:hypothetical protein